MVRVRKLLADAREDRYGVGRFLEEQLRELAKDYPKQFGKFQQEMRQAGPEGVHSSELPDHLKTRLLCTSAVYVLCQIDMVEALDTLGWLSQQPGPPVGRKFLFYAMHRLVSESGQVGSFERYEEYLGKIERMGISGPKRSEVSAWNAQYHESDFRRMFPESKIDIGAQQTIDLERFPRLDELSSSEVKSLLADLRHIIG